MLYFCTETVDDKLSWMEVLNAATESLQAEPQDKFEKRKKSVRQRMTRRVCILEISARVTVTDTKRNWVEVINRIIGLNFGLDEFCSGFINRGQYHTTVFLWPVLTWLTLYSLTSVCIFSMLLPRHFLRFWQGEFVQQSRVSLVDDLLL